MTKATKQTQAQDNVKTLADFNKVKSPYIRYLLGLGMDRKAIVARFKEVDGVTIRYQHVRNVEITPLKGKKD